MQVDAPPILQDGDKFFPRRRREDFHVMAETSMTIGADAKLPSRPFLDAILKARV
jgi:hypothetical protein